MFSHMEGETDAGKSTSRPVFLLIFRTMSMKRNSSGVSSITQPVNIYVKNSNILEVVGHRMAVAIVGNLSS